MIRPVTVSRKNEMLFFNPSTWSIELPRNPAGKILKSVLRGDGASSAFTPSDSDDSAL